MKCIGFFLERHVYPKFGSKSPNTGLLLLGSSVAYESLSNLQLDFFRKKCKIDMIAFILGI